MTLLSEVVDVVELQQLIAEGYVRRQVHPEDPRWMIFGYSQKAVQIPVWSETLRECRGLIARTDNRGVDEGLWTLAEVLARPFAKFWNTGEAQAVAWLQDVQPSTQVYAMDKMDGCLHTNTTLSLWGGGTVTIGKLVAGRLPVTLVGMDEAGNLVPSVVTDWHNNGRKDEWVSVEVTASTSRVSGAAGKPTKIKATADHKFFANGEWVEAQYLKPNDRLVTRGWAPDDKAMRLIRASLLGDGSISLDAGGAKARFSEGHKREHAEYTEAVNKALGSAGSHRSDTVSGFDTEIVWAGSKMYPALAEVRKEFYPDGVRRVPADLSWLDDFSVAKWYMDDGSLGHSELQRDRANFATNAYPREDVERLAAHLRASYGVSATVQDSKGWTIRLNAGRDDSLETFWAAIAPHVHPVMRYKLPSRWRDEIYVEMEIGSEVVEPREARVVSVTKLENTKKNFPSGRTGFDVTTTTHNFLARGVIVHNSLGIGYIGPDGLPAIATRGSFASDQALHATRVLRDKYPTWEPQHDYTDLFEIVFPENRIVLDYGSMDDLIYLAFRRISTGEIGIPQADESGDNPFWTGPSTPVVFKGEYQEALALASRKDREGVVLYIPKGETFSLTKAKEPDYVALHRIVTGLSERAVWEQLQPLGEAADSQAAFKEFLAKLPEEHAGWARRVAQDLFGRWDAIWDQVTRAEHRITAMVGEVPKDFADAIKDEPNKHLLFMAFRSQWDRLGKAIWQELRPAGNTYPRLLQDDDEPVIAA